LAAAGPLRRVDIIAEAMNTKGVCLQYLGRLDEGIALIRASVELAAAHFLSAAELRARFNLAGRLSSDDPGGGIETLRTGLEVARRTGRRDWLILLSHVLSSRLVTGAMEFAAGLSMLDEVADADKPPEERAMAIVHRARIRAFRGDRTAWENAIAEARALTEATSNPQRDWERAEAATMVAIAEGRLTDAAREATAIGGNWAPAGTVARARIALRTGDLELARSAVGSSEIAGETGAVFDALRIGLNAGISALESRHDEAVAGYRDAVRRARQLSLSMDAADLLLDAVFVLGPSDPETPAFADEARALFEAAGARAQLDRLDEALAAGSRPVSTRAASADAAAVGDRATNR
jgi:tetratricopeptide (TPR) repeat protein